MLSECQLELWMKLCLFFGFTWSVESPPICNAIVKDHCEQINTIEEIVLKSKLLFETKFVHDAVFFSNILWALFYCTDSNERCYRCLRAISIWRQNRNDFNKYVKITCWSGETNQLQFWVFVRMDWLIRLFGNLIEFNI